MSEQESLRQSARENLVKSQYEHEQKKGASLPDYRAVEKWVHERADICDRKRDEK